MSKNAWVQYGQDGLSAFDANDLRRIWLDALNAAFSFYDAAGLRRVFLDGMSPGLSFYDTAGNRRIFIDGVNTIQSFSDGTRDRVQLGNLPAYTDPTGVASSAGYGGRAVDANGNLIWDTSGVSQVMKSLGIGSQSGGTQNFASSTYADIPGSTVSVTTSRQVNLFVLWIFSCKVTSGTGNGLVRCNPGSAGSPSGGGYAGNTQFITLTGYQFLPNVAAGTYTIKLQAANDDNISNLQILGSNIQVFQLGG